MKDLYCKNILTVYGEEKETKYYEMPQNFLIILK